MMREDWVEINLGTLLAYIQPTKYIVNSTNYSDSYKTPVLTPGKSFIKGYTNEPGGIFSELPVIIFDDFTTASRYVNFPFKVKSSAMKILVPTSKYVNVKLTYYLMQVLQERSDTHKRYWISIYSKLPIPLAPLPEQRAIVSKIEKLLSDLDNGIANLKTAKGNLEIYRQAVLKKAFEGELTKEWRKQKHIENSWVKKSFDDITASLKRGPFGGDLKKEFFVENGYPVYEQQHAINNNFSNIRYFIDEKRYEKLKACNVGPGDYIVSCSGTMGKIARLPSESQNGIINQALLRIRINEDLIIHKYFVEYFKSSIFQDLILKDSRGTGMQNMAGIKEIKPILIDLPPREEQHQIVHEIEARLPLCDKLSEIIDQSLEKSEALRQSILKKAFEGKLLNEAELEACRQENDWEPADKLLERIKKEKVKTSNITV